MVFTLEDVGSHVWWIFTGIKRGFQAKIQKQFDEQVSYYKKKKTALRQRIRRHFKKQAR